MKKALAVLLAATLVLGAGAALAEPKYKEHYRGSQKIRSEHAEKQAHYRFPWLLAVFSADQAVILCIVKIYM